MLERRVEERRHEFRESDAHFRCHFCVAVVDQILEIARKTFVGASQFECEHFAATGKVAVLVGDAAAHAEVSLRVCAFKFEGDTHLFGARQQYVGVKHFGVALIAGGTREDVDIAEDGQTVECFVGLVDVGGGIIFVRTDEYLLRQGLR